MEMPHRQKKDRYARQSATVKRKILFGYSIIAHLIIKVNRRYKMAKGKYGDCLTIAEASELMGVSQQYVRIGLQRGILPFGYAVQIGAGAHRYTYFISKQKFTEHTGITVERI
jgi:hypothetical protein